MKYLLDTAHQPVAPSAATGRRIVRFDPEVEAFTEELRIRAVVVDEHGHVLHIVAVDTNGTELAVLPTHVALPAVTNEMITRGADRLVASWRHQPDPEKREHQKQTAHKHAQLVLEAAIEGRHS